MDRLLVCTHCGNSWVLSILMCICFWLIFFTVRRSQQQREHQVMFRDNRICAAINELHEEARDVVWIYADGDEDLDGFSSLIECCGSWTGNEDRQFSGDSLLECLEKAVEARRKGNA